MQAQEAAIQGIKRLHGLGITTRRPDDYFAEMAKSDEHMKKVSRLQKQGFGSSRFEQKMARSTYSATGPGKPFASTTKNEIEQKNKCAVLTCFFDFFI
jgi:hypothetical protein